MIRFFRFVARTLCVVIAAFLVIAVGCGGLFFYLNAPPPLPPGMAGIDVEGVTVSTEGVTRVVVRDGETAGSVGRRLEDAGLIRSGLLWNLVSRFRRDFIKQGVYEISAPMTLVELRGLLETGRQEMTRVTVPEGVTLSKMASILAKHGITTVENFLAAASDKTILAEYGIPGTTAEGYLYPDTYFFPQEYAARLVVKTMLDTFYEKLALLPGNGQTTTAALHEKVILASIVEREYRVPEEAPLMSGVFYNRLNIGMRLQSCATVEYIITEIQGKPHPARLFYRDLEIPSPYNTYRVPGLPPGPISAPGNVALNAVFNPESSDYLYFRLADADAGRHYFSKTNEEHNNALVLYVKARPVD